MSDFATAINRLMCFRHSDGCFSPYPEKAIIKARKLYKKYNLEESWREPISRHISLHTRKVIEALSMVDRTQPVVTQAIKANKNFKAFDFSYQDIINEITKGVFCKLIVTGVDSTLFATLLGYSKIKKKVNKQDKKIANLIRKKIITIIQRYDSIMNPSNLCWALCLWKQEREKFNESFNQLAVDKHKTTESNFSSKDCANSMESWETLLTACINKLQGESQKYIPKMDLPAFEIKEFYGGACRPTAYMFLNLKKILKPVGSNHQGIYQTVSNVADETFSWINLNAEDFYENPYLLALYIECLLENECVSKEEAVSILARVQANLKVKTGFLQALELKPNVYGIGVNLKSLFKKFKKKK